MKNIGKELVEKFCKHQGDENFSVKEYELIDAINKALQTKLNSDNTIINSTVDERVYNREEVCDLLWKSFCKYARSEYSDKDGKEWIEQNLKTL